MDNRTVHFPDSLRCDVVICTRDRPELLDRCLEQVARLNYPNYQITVVDNSSGDARTKIASERWGARYIHEPTTGLSRARNRGARESNADIVAFLDDDAVPAVDWLARLVAEFADPEVTVVTGRILSLPCENIDQSLAAQPLLTCGDVRKRITQQTRHWWEMACFGGVGHGGQMAFRRKVFDEWAGFDPRLGRGAPIAGNEEHYAFFTLLKLGHAIVYVPDAIVYHPSPAGNDGRCSRQLRDCKAAIAFFLFLFFEEPRYRWAVVKYIVEAAFGKKRVWRGPAMPREAPSRAPAWRKWLARLGGVKLYLQSRLPATAVSRVRPGRRS